MTKTCALIYLQKKGKKAKKKKKKEKGNIQHGQAPLIFFDNPGSPYMILLIADIFISICPFFFFW